jgi:tetratricopeptide (TPR) repeat protein
MASEAFRWIEVTAGAAAATSHAQTCELLAASAIGACQRADMDAAKAAALAAATAGDHHLVQQARADAALLVGDVDSAASAYEAAYQGAAHDNDPLSAVWDLSSVALARAYGGFSDAVTVAERSLAIALECGSPSAHAFAEFTLGEIYAYDDPSRAETHHRRAIELATPVGSRYVIGFAQVALASIYARGSDPAQALDHYKSVIADWHANDAWAPLRITMRSLADLLERLGATAQAAVLYGAISSTNDPLPAYGADALLLRRLGERLAAQLAPDEFSRLAQEGRALSDFDLGMRALDAIRTVDSGPSPRTVFDQS